MAPPNSVHPAPLTSKGVDGTPYTRRADIEAGIARAQGMTHGGFSVSVKFCGDILPVRPDQALSGTCHVHQLDLCQPEIVHALHEVLELFQPDGLGKVAVRLKLVASRNIGFRV
jgi:hypothetical protein